MNEPEKLGKEEKRKSFLDKMSSTMDTDSIVGKMSAGLGSGFIESIVKQLDPFIDPMLKGVTEALGDDETMILLRRNKKDGKAYVHIIDTSKVKAFSIEEDGILDTIDGANFIKSILSGDLKEMSSKLNKIDSSATKQLESPKH